MTTVNILNVRPQDKNHAIFVSAGDRQTFATYALENLRDTFDILIFQYGSKELEHHQKMGARLLAQGTGSKFNALKEIFRNRPDVFSHYETIWVCDDDLIRENGDYRILPNVLAALGAQIVSPAHSLKGKISHEIMLPVLGRHFFRFTSFVEMTCPVFSSKALQKFLEQYDGSLSGYGDDWWYLNVIGANEHNVVGVVDTVTVINPADRQKMMGYSEAELLGDREQLRLRWLAAKERHGLHQWPTRTLAYVNPHQLTSMPSDIGAKLFRRRFKDDLRTSISALNHAVRCYKLRNRHAR